MAQKRAALLEKRMRREKESQMKKVQQVPKDGDKEKLLPLGGAESSSAV